MSSPKSGARLEPNEPNNFIMKRFSEQLHKQAQSVRLQAAEKSELRERLVSYMEYHPLPSSVRGEELVAKKSSIKSPLFTDAFTMVKVPFSTLFKSSAVAAGLLVMLIPFVAERAVPGDALYAVKVQFNEELRSTLTFDAYQKFEWETERVNRRIAEARLLANEGRLTEAVEAGVAEAVKTHTENAQREIDVLRTQDADAAAIASIALDTTLEVQSNSLRDGESTIVEEGEVTSVSSHPIGLIASVIDKSRIESEAKNASSSLPAYDKLMARVEQNTTRMYELLGSLKDSATPVQLADVTRRVEDIERSILEAIPLSGQDEQQARINLVGVLQRTQKLIVFMTELNVIQTIDIEKLVPVVLTDQEEAVMTEQKSAELEKKLRQIKSTVEVIDSEVIKEKVESAITLMEESAAVMSNTTDFDNFRAVADEALAIANDTLILLEQNRYQISHEIDVDTASSTTAGLNGTTTASSTTDTPDVEPVSSTTEEVYPEWGNEDAVDL